MQQLGIALHRFSSSVIGSLDAHGVDIGQLLRLRGRLELPSAGLGITGPDASRRRRSPGAPRHEPEA
jgi:hypothetical protein